LTGIKGKKTCTDINKEDLCDVEVKNEGSKTAVEFCTSCGCGEVLDPSPSPPDDECKGDEVKIELKGKGKKTCAKIKERSFCNEKVIVADGNTKRASDFCTICGCG